MTRRFLLAFSLALTVTSSALAQQQSTSSVQFDDWVMNCGSQTGKDNKSVKSCEARSTVVIHDDKSNQNFSAATIMFVRPMLGKTVQASVQVPIAAMLANPVIIAGSDGKEIARLSYIACQPQLCVATAQLEDKQLAALRKIGDRLSITYSHQNGQNIKIDASAKGLGAAFDALLKEK